MNTEMQITLTIVWLAGVVCGTAFFVGVGTLVYCLAKKYFTRLAGPLIAIAIGIIGMSYSLFTLLRLVGSWITT